MRGFSGGGDFVGPVGDTLSGGADLPVILTNLKNDVMEVTAGWLLPHGFGNSDLDMK